MYLNGSWLASHGFSEHQLLPLYMTLRLCAEQWRAGKKQDTDITTQERLFSSPSLLLSSLSLKTTGTQSASQM